MGRPGLSRHPKFLLLARTLGDENLARGVLEHGWEVAYEAGDDRLGNPDAVEAACRWRGERGVCFAALRDAGGAPGRVGFIEEREGVWCVHDLYDHAPDYVRKRAAREEQRRVKGRSLAAERRTLTGQSPGSDQALTPPRAPAPTRAPAQEDLPEVVALRDAWNAHTAPPIPRWTPKSDLLRKMAAAALARRPLAQWVEVFKRIQASPKLRGEDPSLGGWKADVEWALRPEGKKQEPAQTVLDGKWDPPATASTPARRTMLL